MRPSTPRMMVGVGYVKKRKTTFYTLTIITNAAQEQRVVANVSEGCYVSSATPH